jgi:hypothetical protein
MTNQCTPRELCSKLNQINDNFNYSGKSAIVANWLDLDGEVQTIAFLSTNTIVRLQKFKLSVYAKSYLMDYKCRLIESELEESGLLPKDTNIIGFALTEEDIVALLSELKELEEQQITFSVNYID